jgi:hypothetical protein
MARIRGGQAVIQKPGDDFDDKKTAVVTRAIFRARTLSESAF